MAERRSSPRFNPSSETFGRIKATLPARIIDISPTGMQVEIATGLRPTVECDVAVPTEEGELRLRAAVRRCRAIGTGRGSATERGMLFRAGLEFLGIRTEDAEALVVSYGIGAPLNSPGGSQPRGDRGPVKIRVSTEHVYRKVKKS